MHMLTAERIFTLRLLCDASDEGLGFTRMMDDERTGVSVMGSTIKGYMDKLQVLFVDGGAVSVEGSFTQFALGLLCSPRTMTWFDSQGQLHRIGGVSGGIPCATMQTCLQRMAGYIAFVFAVLRQEFPDFELNQAFSILDIDGHQAIASNNCEVTNATVSDNRCFVQSSPCVLYVQS